VELQGDKMKAKVRGDSDIDKNKWLLPLFDIMMQHSTSAEAEAGAPKQPYPGFPKACCDDSSTLVPHLYVKDEVLTSANVQLLCSNLTAKLYEHMLVNETSTLKHVSVDVSKESPCLMAKPGGEKYISMTLAGPVVTTYGANCLPILVAQLDLACLFLFRAFYLHCCMSWWVEEEPKTCARHLLALLLYHSNPFYFYYYQYYRACCYLLLLLLPTPTYTRPDIADTYYRNIRSLTCLAKVIVSKSMRSHVTLYVTCEQGQKNFNSISFVPGWACKTSGKPNLAMMRDNMTLEVAGRVAEIFDASDSEDLA
jgi:hypothetical protein